MTPLFPAMLREDNLTIADSKHSAEFITVAFALLSRGWVFAAIGALGALAIFGTYFKSRERELLDQITSLKAMVAKDLEESGVRMDKKVLDIKNEMSEQLKEQKVKHEEEKATLRAKQAELEIETDGLKETRKEHEHQIKQMQQEKERHGQEHLEEILHLKKETEDRLEAQQAEIERVHEETIAEQAATIEELQKKVAALETALLHW